jgi:hypothetical protein
VPGKILALPIGEKAIKKHQAVLLVSVVYSHSRFSNSFTLTFMVWMHLKHNLINLRNFKLLLLFSNVLAGFYLMDQ